MPIPVSWPVIGGTPYSVPVTGETNWGNLTNYLVALSTAQGTQAQKFAARVATATPVIVTSATDCAIVVDLLVPGPTTVQLPPGVNGQFYSISDGKGDAGVNNITVLPAVGATINGDPNFVINSNDDAIGLIYTASNNNWKVTSQILSFTPGSVARAAIQAGTPDYVVINAPVTGFLSEEQFLNQVRGGFGQNVSAFDGVVKAALGSFSASTIVNADVAVGANIDVEKLSNGSVNNTEFNRIPQIGRYAATTKITGGVASVNGGNPALFDLTGGTGQIIDYVSDPPEPDYINVTWPSFSAQTVTNLATADFTYVSINSAGAIVQQTTFPTPSERRTNIFLTRLNHSNRVSIGFVDNIGGNSVSAPNQLQDLIDALGPFNISGNVLSANGANLNINKSAGTMFERYYNQVATPLNPHVVTTAALTVASFRYATRSTVGATVTAIDPANYDVAGVVTPVPGGGATSTIQRVFLFPSNNLTVQYGQNFYATLADAVAAISSDSFVINPTNQGFPILIGYIVMRKDATLLNNAAQARFLPAARFDAGAGGGAGGGATTLLQAYLNSVVPILTLTPGVGAFNIRDALAPLGTSLFNVQNNAASISYIDVSTQGVKSNQFPTAGRVMVTDVNSAASQSAVTSTELGYLSGTTGVTGTGSIVRNVSPVINTPDIDGGTASNTSRITIPKNTYANLLTLTRKEGTILYATDLDLFFADDGIALSPIGSGGSLNTNMIANPNNATGWTRTGSLFAVPVTTTTAGDLPLGGIVSSAIQLVSSNPGTEATDYVSYSVTTPATFGGKLQINFFQRPGAGFVSGQWTLSVYQGSTRQSLSSDSAGVTTLSAVNGPMTVSMDATASTAYTLRFARTSGAGSATLNVANVFFGYPNIVQGAAVGSYPWSPVFSAGYGTPTGISLFARRVGESLHLSGKFTTGAVSAAPSTISLPPGLTPLGTATFVYSGGKWVRFVAGATAIKQGVVGYTAGTGSIFLSYDDTGNASNPSLIPNVIDIIGNTTTVSFDGEIVIPIAEWSGNGTVNLGPGAQVEYVSDDGTNDVFGPNGSLVPNVAFSTGATNRDFSFQYSQQAIQDISVEINYRGFGWSKATDLFPFSQGNNGTTANSYGIRGFWLNSTTFRVAFGNQGTDVAASNISNGNNSWATEFANGTRFRVPKANPSAPVGFGLAGTDGSAGLVNPYTVGSGVVYSGKYTPVITASTGFVIGTIHVAAYSRVGNIVTVSGSFFSSLLASTNHTATISLPIPRTTTPAQYGGGSGTGTYARGGAGSVAFVIYPNSSLTTMVIEAWAPATLASDAIGFIFSYAIA